MGQHKRELSKVLCPNGPVVPIQLFIFLSDHPLRLDLRCVQGQDKSASLSRSLNSRRVGSGERLQPGDEEARREGNCLR